MKKKWKTPGVSCFGSFTEMTKASTTGCPVGGELPPGKLANPGDDSCLNTTCGLGNCEDGGGGALS